MISKLQAAQQQTQQAGQQQQQQQVAPEPQQKQAEPEQQQQKVETEQKEQQQIPETRQDPQAQGPTAPEAQGAPPAADAAAAASLDPQIIAAEAACPRPLLPVLNACPPCSPTDCFCSDGKKLSLEDQAKANEVSWGRIKRKF